MSGAGPGSNSPNMRKDIEHGRKHERNALKAASEELQMKIRPKQRYKDSNNKIVIPDGVTEDGSPVEVKCPRPRDGESSLSDMAEKRKNFYFNSDGDVNKKNPAYDQVQKQIDATGADEGYLVVYYNDDEGTEETKVVPVLRDQDRINQLLEREKDKDDLVSQFSSLNVADKKY
ncbi:hypothetical protein EB796_004681 [Bugula neritina]|uniref:Uncharacterized protein n=1 Tax=Bugula neritina TaxID=10212 RepID=A0A7J7KHQ3_BUGNE|nr:hypothetical protein EB796_004681 [Bugula neritina]